MAEIKFLDKAGLTQVISHLQQDTDEKIAQAIEDVIFAGDSDENVDNLPYLDAEKLNGYTSDDFVKVADLGTTTVGLATADAEGNIISSTYAKNSDMNSGFVSLQSQIDNKVDKTTTVNGKALSSNIAITATDVGADSQGAAANALKEAKTYAEGQASSALTSAKAYTDTEVTSTYGAAKTYAESQAASALKSAKTYADTASATALSEAKSYNDDAYANANAYTDKKIADLINGAPTTLDTLGEIATAMNNNADVVEALNEAIGTKANTADLANYFENTGGNVNGNVNVIASNATARNVRIANSLRAIDIGVNSSGGGYITDVTNNEPLCEFLADGRKYFHGTATENLPLTGGLISSADQTPITVQHTSGNNAFIRYRGTTSDVGSLGFADTNMPAFIANDGSYYRKLLHEGNYFDYALPLSGGTMDGALTVKNVIFGYNYNKNGNAPAFVFDKPGSYATGIGANGSDDTIYFGAVNPADFSWYNNYAQKWKFGGTLEVTGNIKFSSALTENTSPTVVATFGSNNSANGFNYTSTSNLSVGYATSAGSISNQGSAATKDIVHTTTDPGAGAASSYKEGSIICVYE